MGSAQLNRVFQRHKPVGREFREELAVDQDEFAKIKRDSPAAGGGTLSRKSSANADDRESEEIDVLQHDRRADPFDAVSKQDLKKLITQAMSRRERMIVVLYYYEAMTMREIGRVLDLSESRVSQLHTSILLRLRAQLQQRPVNGQR